MFSGLAANAIAQIDTAERLIHVHEALAEDSVDRLAIKQYAAASCLTRLYAIFEWFVESSIAEFLDALPELVPFGTLEDDLKNAYRSGVSHILDRIDSERYKHLIHETVVRWYYEALSNSSPYRLIAEALTRHEQNLRLPVLDGLLARLQAKDVRQWLSWSPDVVSLFGEAPVSVDLVESELRNLIQLRNDAAHGLLSDLPGVGVLVRFCLLVKALVSSVASFLRRALIERRLKADKMLLIGSVTEVFARPGAFVATMKLNVEVRLGATLYFSGRGFCDEEKVLSIMDNDIRVGEIRAVRDGYEVGLQCDHLPRRNSLIFAEMAHGSMDEVDVSSLVSGGQVEDE